MTESAGRILMLVENSFPGDTRVRNEAYTLKDAGYQVSVVALRNNGEPFAEDLDGIRIYRLPTLTLFKKKTDESASRLRGFLSGIKSAAGYALEYVYFTSGCLILSPYIALRDGFDVIHAHNPPDTLCLVSAFYKPFGKKFVFDHHDLSPELYQSRFGAGTSLISKSLLWFEKLSLRLANVSIATNESYKQIQIERGRRDPDTVFVVRNGPDLRRLQPVAADERLKSKRKKILVYVGEMNPQDGVDYLLRALHKLAYQLNRKDFFCVLIGKGDSLEDLKALSSELNLEDLIWFTGFISDEDLNRYLSTADICMDPNPSSPLNDHSTWIKVMEYMALGKPIVSFDLKETRFSAQEAAVYVTPNDELEYARAVARLMDDSQLRETMGNYGRTRVETELKWEIVSRNLIQAYKRLDLLNRKGASNGE